MATGWAPGPNGSILPSPVDTHWWLADGSRVWNVLCFMAFIIESHKHRTRTRRFVGWSHFIRPSIFLAQLQCVCVCICVVALMQKVEKSIRKVAVAAHKLTFITASAPATRRLHRSHAQQSYRIGKRQNIEKETQTLTHTSRIRFASQEVRL